MVFIEEDGKKKEYEIILPPLEDLPKDNYSNHAVITHTANEFTFYFGRVEAPINTEQLPKGDKIELPIASKIVMTPNAAKGFLDAFNGNWDRFEKRYMKKKK